MLFHGVDMPPSGPGGSAPALVLHGQCWRPGGAAWLVGLWSVGDSGEDGLGTVLGSRSPLAQGGLPQCPEPVGALGRKRVCGGEGDSWRTKEETM